MARLDAKMHASCTNIYVHSMAFPVVEFSREGYEIRKVFG
jgi:hypothetical protein